MKRAASTLHLIEQWGGFSQAGGRLSWCIRCLAFWTQLHSWRTSWARVIVRIGVLSLSPQNNRYRLFHKLQRVIAASCLCWSWSLLDKSKSICWKESALGSNSWIMPPMSGRFQQAIALWQTNNKCIWDSARRSQDTQVSEHGTPRLERLSRVGRQWWAAYIYIYE